MMPDPNFWKYRRVFLTGHTGFKGSWLCLWLKMLGADVTGYSLEPPTKPSLFEQAHVGDCVHTITADVRDFYRLHEALDDCRPEVVIHMAAQTVVRRGYDDPLNTYSTNVMGTVNLFEALRRLGNACAVINVTSDKCYDNREWVWGYRETDRLGGRDPYSNSKACAELVTNAFRESFFSRAETSRHGIAVATVRAGNVIGGGDWTAWQLIPDLMRAFLAGRSCLIRNPGARRPWQFVLEPLRGYLVLAERLAERSETFATGWNFGPAYEDNKPVAWIADRLAGLWGDGATWNHDGTPHPHEAQSLMLDATKAAGLLGWSPLLPINSALDWVARWYQTLKRGGDLERVTREQIESYEALSRDMKPADQLPCTQHLGVEHLVDLHDRM